MSLGNTNSHFARHENRRRFDLASRIPLLSPLSLGVPARLAISAVCASLLWTGVIWALQ